MNIQFMRKSLKLIEMEKFKIVLAQVNAKGERSKVAVAENINVTSVDNLANEVADFCKGFVELTEKRKAAGIKGYTKGSIRKTSTLVAELTAVEDETTATVRITNFGQWVAASKQEAIAAHLADEIDFVQRFSHLWSAGAANAVKVAQELVEA